MCTSCGTNTDPSCCQTDDMQVIQSAVRSQPESRLTVSVIDNMTAIQLAPQFSCMTVVSPIFVSYSLIHGGIDVTVVSMEQLIMTTACIFVLE